MILGHVYCVCNQFFLFNSISSTFLIWKLFIQARKFYTYTQFYNLRMMQTYGKKQVKKWGIFWGLITAIFCITSMQWKNESLTWTKLYTKSVLCKFRAIVLKPKIWPMKNKFNFQQSKYTEIPVKFRFFDSLVNFELYSLLLKIKYWSVLN